MTVPSVAGTVSACGSRATLEVAIHGYVAIYAHRPGRPVYGIHTGTHPPYPRVYTPLLPAFHRFYRLFTAFTGISPLLLAFTGISPLLLAFTGISPTLLAFTGISPTLLAFTGIYRHFLTLLLDLPAFPHPFIGFTGLLLACQWIYRPFTGLTVDLPAFLTPLMDLPASLDQGGLTVAGYPLRYGGFLHKWCFLPAPLRW